MSKGKITHNSILNKAFELASQNGLESLTIGSLAKLCEMSKSGLFAHFNSKENLQVSVVEYAKQVFVERVIFQTQGQDYNSAEHRIRVLASNWINWNHSFHGSSMFLDALKDTPNAETLTQQKLKEVIMSWIQYLDVQIAKGIESKEFSSDLESQQAAFELYGLYLSAQLSYSLQGKNLSYDRFEKGLDRLLASWK